MHRHAIYVLVLTVAALSCLGMVMLSSTGAFAQECGGDMYYFVKKQGLWLTIGLLVAATVACVDYQIWKKLWPAAFILAFVLLLLCFIPPIGLRINGSSRWIGMVGMTFQPSELAKVSAIFFLAWWFDRHREKSATFLTGFFFPLIVIGTLVTPILLEVDMGTTALIMASSLCVMFLAGTSLRWLVPVAVAGLGGVLFLATQIEERMGRLMAFMDPEKYRLSEGLQQWQALIAFGSGGMGGLGLGQGRQKMLYLPYAHTDFIFPMIGEELGLWATLATVFGYLLICFCGAQIALNTQDRFGSLLAFGCVMVLTLQAAVNIGVTTSLLPNKGMPLPFISFGGSGLVICYFMVGLLVSVHRFGHATAPALSPALRRARTYCRV